MTTIQIKSWVGDNFTRFYITNAATGEQIGYIQTSLQTEGYGDGYYASHRAAKGDFGADVVSSIRVVGDERVLNAVLDLARSRHPLVTELGRDITSPQVAKEIDLVLHRMTTNQPLPFGIPKSSKARQRAEIRSRTYNV